ncbi:MAG: protein-glutamate O-methyltransferase CheR [Magnetococcales bacterium]|nr:protein-glutamate O-methyltransferase CheR [Magnetococcales bacterium]NGZ28999.1 protein-glutamate O-methyltransferase CheR [Magnetococcales bacterium]
MMKSPLEEWKVMTDEEFSQLSQLVQEHLGIHWDGRKKEMVQNRLRKRIKFLKLESFHHYVQFLVEHPGHPEWQELYNGVTTNLTTFFREPLHFSFLQNEWIPFLQRRALTGRGRKLRLWSAACSTGAEPYSLAMLLHHHFGTTGPLKWDIRMLASDINTKVLEQAKNGCYLAEEVAGVPPVLREAYFKEKTLNSGQRCYCVRTSLQEMIDFRSINLMNTTYPIKTKLDLILCRNVLIYFERKTSLAIVHRLIDLLHEGGYLLLGHAEALPELPGVRRLPGNIYQKPTAGIEC